MFHVPNKKVITKLSRKSITANKTRNRIVILAIALTTILFTSLFTIGIGMIESIEQQTLRQAGGDGHIAFKYITEEEYQKLSSHKLIKEASYNKLVADKVTSPAFLKRRLEMYYMDETGMRLGFCTPTTGNAPVLTNEIAMDTLSLDLLEVPHELGSKVTLSYQMGEQEFTTDFILSGFWESDTAINVGFALVSEEFTKEYADALTYTYHENDKFAGIINSYVMCNSRRNLQGQMEQIIQDSGYTIEDDDFTTPRLDTDISGNVNWAYIGGGDSMDFGVILSIIVALLLFTFTGYLIIYNIFQISVIHDIRFYGLLKTIGTTGRQLTKLVIHQALYLSIFGIPFGLVIGYMIGKYMLPLVMSQSSYTGVPVVSLNPFIFIGASIFSLLTVLLSTRKPCKLAAQVSPVEAVKYADNCTYTQKEKHSKDGGKIMKMAFSNLQRNKKRTIITILSLSLSLILLNTVFTLSNGFDMDKYLKKFTDTDFLVGHANYFNMNRFRSAEDAVSETMIAAIEKEDSFLEGGRIYYSLDDCSIDKNVTAEERMNTALNGKPTMQLFGLDQLPLSRIDLYEGTLDFDKLATGNYIIEGVDTDDNNEVEPNSSHYAIGDKVTLYINGTTHEFEVLAKMKISYYTNYVRYKTSPFAMYLPSDIYKKIVKDPVAMTYAYNVKEGTLPQMESFIKKYTTTVEKTMNYESKLVQIKSFEGLQNMTLTVGGILSAIMGFIGLLNFVNSILTSITTRKREFATLQSIGMTNSQLIKMLCLEGLYYTLLTIVSALLIGTIFSVIVVGGIVGMLWMFSYHFTLVPILVSCPILLLLGAIIPILVYHSVNRQSIVERLREAE